MKLQIPTYGDVPSANLFVEILTKDNCELGINGRKVMILVPGGPGGNHTVYNSIKENLLEFADLVLFDPRGCGYSDVSPLEYCSLDHFIDDIELLRRALGLKNFILFGGSYGSIAALGYATKYSQFLEKLILISGGMADSQYLQTAKEYLKSHGSLEQIKIAEHLWDGTFRDADHFDEFYRIMAPLYIYNKDNMNTIPTTESRIPYNIEITNFGFGNFLRRFDCVSDLNKITCETLILAGQNDWIIDLSSIKKTSEKIPNCILSIFNECSHFLWVDQREKFFQKITHFFNKAS